MGHTYTQQANTQQTMEGPRALETELDANYYLSNFNYLLNYVAQQYSALLNANEQAFRQTYNALPFNAQQLYARLALRTHELLRFSKISYPEINNIDAALRELTNTGLASHATDLNNDDITTLFTQVEIKSALHLTGGKSSAAAINADSLNNAEWHTPDLFGDTPIQHLLATDAIIHLHHKEHIKTFKLLFFGNLHQDFSSFVLRDLGKQRFESYSLLHNTLYFQSRQQLDAHLQFYQCAEWCDEAITNPDNIERPQIDPPDHLFQLIKSLPDPISSDRTLCRRLDRLKNRVARQLERYSADDLAATIYKDVNRPPARERLARLAAKSGNAQQAIEMCRQMRIKPYDSEEYDTANKLGGRLARQYKIESVFDTPYQPPESKIQLDHSNLPVEFIAALHLAKSGKCYHLENNLINGVFGLAFWDIIFAPVTGAFHHPFQYGPTDLYEPEFISSRKDKINTRLSELNHGKLRSLVFRHLYMKNGLRNAFVNWYILKPHIIDLALKRVPLKDWVILFTQLLSDLKNYRAGQPDLIFFPDSGGYQFIEVKGPGDRLQANQQRWMLCFDQYRIEHSVMHVEFTQTSRSNDAT